MSTTTVSVSFDPDSEGFVSRSCPACDEPFKISPGKGNPGPVAYCPFCRHEGARWETGEQLEYAKAFAARQVIQPQLDKLESTFRSLGRAGGIAVKGSMTKLKAPAKPIEETGALPARTTFACCGETIRHEDRLQPRYCVICGSSGHS